MDKTESLSHTRWECKHHIVFIPKWRLAEQKGESSRGGAPDA
jgi:hypothetical protein